MFPPSIGSAESSFGAVPGPSVVGAPVSDVIKEIMMPEKSAPVVPVEETISGFATDIPLAIALQQVAPAGYQFSFSSGVNPGTIVSWAGGKPWKQVLTSMLAEKNLSFHLEKNALVVTADAGMRRSAPARKTGEDTMPLMIRPDQASKPQPEEQEALSVREVASLPAVSEAAALPETEPFTVPVPVSEITWQPAAETAEQSVAPKSAVEAAARSAFDASAWTVSRGETLREVLTRWSKMSGTELYWSIDYDYRTAAPVSFSGNFNEAVGQLLDRFKAARPQPYGRVYQNPGKQKVLVIGSYDISD